MFEKFFGLQANPFRINPDPRALLLTGHMHEALASLVYGLHTRRGFVLLTGEVGTGKTTLLNLLLAYLKSKNAATAFVFNPRMDARDFLEFVMQDFGVPCEGMSKGQMLHRLNQWLLERHQEGRDVVLVIDEAHALSNEVLEEVRLLTNLETWTEKLIQVVLSAQPEMEERLNQPGLRQLKQRIGMRCKTVPLNPDEAPAYIAKRVQATGSDGVVLFTPEAVARIYELSEGIPRVVNLLCEHSLITAFATQVKPVTEDIVENVAVELDIKPASPLDSETAMECDAMVAEVGTVKAGMKTIRREIDQIKTRSEGRK